jgi:hypothetical protein
LWRHRFNATKDGKQQDYRIGTYPKISMKKARQIRDEQKGKDAYGWNQSMQGKKHEQPERHAAHQAHTPFETVALNWHKSKE